MIEDINDRRKRDGLDKPFEDLLQYQCANCGNKCLADKRPDNSICGGCNSPDWKLLKHQQSYVVGKPDWECKDGEI